MNKRRALDRLRHDIEKALRGREWFFPPDKQTGVAGWDGPDPVFFVAPTCRPVRRVNP